MKLCAIILLMLTLVFGDLFASSLSSKKHSNSNKKSEISELLAKKKKRRKKRRKKKRRKKRRRKKRRKKRRRKKVKEPKFPGEDEIQLRTKRKGPYLIAGLGYYIPSDINFMPVIEAEGNELMTNAKIKYTPGFGLNLGAGYRFGDYFGMDGDLLIIYPTMGSEISVTRDEETAPKTAGGRFLSLKAFLKGFYPYEKYDGYLGLGGGLAYLFKTVPAADEGIALSGYSINAILGVDYDFAKNMRLGGSFEYAQITYNIFDFWDPELTEAAKAGGVTLSQTMMSVAFNFTYLFK